MATILSQPQCVNSNKWLVEYIFGANIVILLEICVGVLCRKSCVTKVQRSEVKWFSISWSVCMSDTCLGQIWWLSFLGSCRDDDHGYLSSFRRHVRITSYTFNSYLLMPQSYYHVLAATSCYVAKRGTTWLRRSCNVRQRGPNVIKRGRT